MCVALKLVTIMMRQTIVTEINALKNVVYFGFIGRGFSLVVAEIRTVDAVRAKCVSDDRRQAL